MDKKEYIFKTLSRTKRKDDENFVLNSIWNKINNYDLKPVSQQYVNCGEQWFLIDLFFPQINIGVEVDEEAHITQIENDKIRSDQIVSAMKYDKRTDFQIVRVQTHSNNIDDVNEQVDSICDFINERISELPTPLHWITRNELLKEIRIKRILSIYDGITFDSITQTVNELFDWGRKSGGGPSRSSFRYKHDRSKSLWFAKRNVFKGDKEIAVSGWINRLSQDGKYILEFRENASDEKYNLGDEHLETTDDIRITFLKYRNNLGEDGYKFVGVYRRIGWIATRFNDRIVRAEKYNRISETINLPETKTI